MERAVDPKPPLPGAKLLRGWLVRQGISVPVFAERYSLDRITVQRLLNGERQRVSVETADAIERATSRAVPWTAWIPSRRRPRVRAA